MSLSELMFLTLLGLVVFGPKKLVALAQEAGRILARLKRISSDFQSQLQAEISTVQSEDSLSCRPGLFAIPSPAIGNSDR